MITGWICPVCNAGLRADVERCDHPQQHLSGPNPYAKTAEQLQADEDERRHFAKHGVPIGGYTG